MQNCNLMEPRHPASTGPNLVAEAALAVANFASVDVPLLRGGALMCFFVGQDIHLESTNPWDSSAFKHCKFVSKNTMAPHGVSPDKPH